MVRSRSPSQIDFRRKRPWMASWGRLRIYQGLTRCRQEDQRKSFSFKKGSGTMKSPTKTNGKWLPIVGQGQQISYFPRLPSFCVVFPLATQSTSRLSENQTRLSSPEPTIRWTSFLKRKTSHSEFCKWFLLSWATKPTSLRSFQLTRSRAGTHR